MKNICRQASYKHRLHRDHHQQRDEQCAQDQQVVAPHRVDPLPTGVGTRPRPTGLGQARRCWRPATTGQPKANRMPDKAAAW